MNIIKDKNNQVLFITAEDIVERKGVWVVNNLNTGISSLNTVEYGVQPNPYPFFKEGVFSYDVGVWSIYNQEMFDSITLVQTLDDSLSYARKRKELYDALNQFEMQFDDAINNTTTWVDAIKAIKATYPKPI